MQIHQSVAQDREGVPLGCKYFSPPVCLRFIVYISAEPFPSRVCFYAWQVSFMETVGEENVSAFAGAALGARPVD